MPVQVFHPMARNPLNEGDDKPVTKAKIVKIFCCGLVNQQKCNVGRSYVNKKVVRTLSHMFDTKVQVTLKMYI